MKQMFRVDGKLPGANDCLWKQHFKLRDLKKKHQRFICFAIRQAKIQPMEYASISIEWHEPDQRRDIDNVMFGQKFVLDALVQMKILKNDGWAQVEKIEHRVVFDPSRPGVVVTLTGIYEGGDRYGQGQGESQEKGHTSGEDATERAGWIGVG